MKIKLYLIALIAILILPSCKKELGGHDEWLLKEYNKKYEPKDLKITQEVKDYNAVIFDSCRSENITLSGKATYITKQSTNPDNGYYLDYIIILTNVVGISDNGVVYKIVGKGWIEGRVKTNAEGTNVDNTSIYKVIYKSCSSDNMVYFLQYAKFVATVDEFGEQHVKTQINLIKDGCI